MAQGKPVLAAQAYEKSYNHGGKLSALFKAALAQTYAGNYDSALAHIETLLAPENALPDEAPHQTRTVLARALWGRFCQSPEAGGGNEDDVIRACQVLRQVLDGEFGNQYLEDAETVYRFVDMVSSPATVSAIADFLQNTWHAEQVLLFGRALGRQHEYPAPIIKVALERLSDAVLWDEIRNGFVKIVCRALVRAYYYGQVDSLSFDELAQRIITSISNLPSGKRKNWLFKLFVVERHASISELIKRYADEAMKIFEPIMGEPEAARLALSDPQLLEQINHFLRKRMPPATQPVAYGHSDVKDLSELVGELVKDSRDEMTEAIEQGNQLDLDFNRGTSPVCLLGWVNTVRPFLLDLLDVPSSYENVTARGPFALLAAEASPWSFKFNVNNSRIDMLFNFASIELTHNPIAMLQHVEQDLKMRCQAAEIKDHLRLNLDELESDA